MALINCPECGKQVSDRAPACPHCGMPLGTVSPPSVPPASPTLVINPTTARRNSGCLAAFGIVICLVVLLAALSTCSGGRRSSSPNTSPSANPAKPEKSASEMLTEVEDTSQSASARKGRADLLLQRYPETPEAAKAKSLLPDLEKSIVSESIGKQWNYGSTEDGMSGKMSRSAWVNSNNQFNFDFPYSGAQRATLTLRKHPRHGNDIIFEIEKGQILCSSYSCPIRVRFDDDAPRTYSGNEPADNSSTYVFLPSYADLSQRIARAKRMRIEVNVHHEGSLQAEFNVDGLKLVNLNSPAKSESR